MSDPFDRPAAKQPLSELTSEELRSRLVGIDDEIRELPTDEFARRFHLASETDKLRAALAEVDGPALEAATEGWAERAGRKGSHEVDYDALKGAIVSPGEAGGMV